MDGVICYLNESLNRGTVMPRTADAWRIVISGLVAMTIASCSADRTEQLDDMVVPKQLSCSMESETNMLPAPYWFMGAQIVRNDSAVIVVEMTISSLPPERYSNLVGNPPSLTDITMYMLDGDSWEDRPLGINRVEIEMERLSRPATAYRTVEVESDDPESLFDTEIESEEEWSTPDEIQVSERGNTIVVAIEPAIFPNLRPGKDFHTEIFIRHENFSNTSDVPMYAWSRCR